MLSCSHAWASWVYNCFYNASWWTQKHGKWSEFLVSAQNSIKTLFSNSKKVSWIKITNFQYFAKIYKVLFEEFAFGMTITECPYFNEMPTIPIYLTSGTKSHTVRLSGFDRKKPRFHPNFWIFFKIFHNFRHFSRKNRRNSFIFLVKRIFFFKFERIWNLRNHFHAFNFSILVKNSRFFTIFW